MAEVTSGIRLTADAQGLVGGSTQSADALKALEEQAKKTGAAFGDMGRASRTAADEQRRVAEDMRRTIEAQMQARQADADRKFEASGLAAQLLAQRDAQAALNAETERGASSMRSSTAEAIAMTAAKSGLRTAMSALMGLFTGPAGLISVLAAGALSWASFGQAATDGVKAAEDAAAKARAAAVAAPTPRQIAQQASAEHAGKIQELQSQIAGLLERRGMSNSPEYQATIDAEIKWRAEQINTRTGEAARMLGQWPEAGPTIADVTRGLRTPAGTRREFDEMVQGLYSVYGSQLSMNGSPEHQAQMQAELLQNYEAARKVFDSQMKGFEPKAGPAGRATGDGESMLIGLKNQLADLTGQGTQVDKVMRALTEGTKEYSEGTKATALALAAQIDAQRNANVEAETARRATEAGTKAYNAGVEQQFKSIQALQEHNTKLAQHNREIGQTKASIDSARASQAEMTLAELEDQRALADSFESQTGLVAILDARIAAQKNLIGLLREGAVAEAAADSAKKAEQEWKRGADNIERSLTDALMRGFDKGKTFGQNLLDSLQNAFKTAVLQPVISAVVRPVAGAIQGAIGGITDSIFGGSGGGGGGGIGNMLSLGSSAYSAISGNSIIGSIGSAMGFGGGAAISGAALAAETAALTGSGMAAGAVGAAGVGAAAAIPYVGVALAALYAMGAFDEGGGPKNSDIHFGHTGGGGWDNPAFGVTFSNNPGGPDQVGGLVAALNDPKQYDPQTLNELLGPVWGNTKTFSGGPGDTAGLVSQLTAYLEPARQAVGQKAQANSQAREALLAAQDPAGYWTGKVSELDAALGTSANTIEDWRTAFLNALDEPLSQDQLTKWQALGAAIEQAGNVAGAAASSISTSQFATLVDYRRAVRLSGGIPKFAGGVENFGGGMALVGEMGPELMHLPAGSSVYSNSDSRRMLDMSGVEQRLERIERAMTAVALHTFKAAKSLDNFDGGGLYVRGSDPATPIDVAVA